MGWVIEAVINWIVVDILDRASRKARPWVATALIVAPIALLIGLIWLLILL